MFLVERKISLFWHRAWANKEVNVVYNRCLAGVGKSTLVKPLASDEWLLKSIVLQS